MGGGGYSSVCEGGGYTATVVFAVICEMKQDSCCVKLKIFSSRNKLEVHFKASLKRKALKDNRYYLLRTKL